MLQDTKKTILDEIHQIAKKNLIKKLKQQGIDPKQLKDEEFQELLDAEIDILKNDTKKVGIGIGLGILFSLFTGI